MEQRISKSNSIYTEALQGIIEELPLQPFILIAPAFRNVENNLLQLIVQSPTWTRHS